MMNKNIRKSINIVCVIFTGLHVLFSQQDAQYTQYMYNTVSVNPGYTGSRGHLSVAALHRSQWLGLEGAPVTQTLNIHSPIGYRGVGLGFSVINETIGPTAETNFDVDFSYTIFTTRKNRLSFGLKGSASLLDVRFSELDFNESIGVDPTLQQDIDNRLSPNVGAGVYYHTPNFYLGFSVPRILQTEHFEESTLSTAQELMNFYLITGYVYEINPFLRFKPALLTKYQTGAPLQVDISANFMFNDKFVLGAAYRWEAAFSGLFGFYFNESLMLGLAYDRDITDLGQVSFNDGSFEVILRYDFIKSRGGMKSPRFF